MYKLLKISCLPQKCVGVYVILQISNYNFAIWNKWIKSTSLAEVINNHLREGDRVRLEDWGMMKLEIESEKVDNLKDFKAKKHIISSQSEIRKPIRSWEQLHFLTKGLGDSERIRIFASLEPAKPLHDAQMCGSFYNSSVMTDEFLFFSYNTTLSGHLIGHLLGHS